MKIEPRPKIRLNAAQRHIEINTNRLRFAARRLSKWKPSLFFKSVLSSGPQKCIIIKKEYAFLGAGGKRISSIK